MSATKTPWVHKFPTKPGMYWFVGERYGRNDFAKEHGSPAEIELMLCQVSKISNGVMVVADGQFMYERELGDEWYFAPARLPEDLPKFADGSDLKRLRSKTARE